MLDHNSLRLDALRGVFIFMSESEFAARIKEEGISPDLYSIEQLKDETLCLRKVFDRWEVFYYERGSERNLKTFYTKSDAYSYLYDKVKATHACHLKNGIS